MSNPAVLREVENASTIYNRSKLLTSEEKHTKMKTKVLGEVKNTLNSRPRNFATPTWVPSANIKSKSSVHSKATSDENSVSKKNIASGNKQYLTPFRVADESLLTSSSIDPELLDMHNHVLCEQAEDSFQNEYFKEYKFSEEQIKNLVQSVKISANSISTTECEPCEDIKLPDEKPEEKIFSFDDILSNLVAPQVPSLVMMLCNAF